MSNVPTLHMIDVFSRPNLRINMRMRVYSRRQIGLAMVIEVVGEQPLGTMAPRVEATRCKIQ